MNLLKKRFRLVEKFVVTGTDLRVLSVLHEKLMWLGDVTRALRHWVVLFSAACWQLPWFSGSFYGRLPFNETFASSSEKENMLGVAMETSAERKGRIARMNAIRRLETSVETADGKKTVTTGQRALVSRSRSVFSPVVQDSCQSIGCWICTTTDEALLHLSLPFLSYMCDFN